MIRTTVLVGLTALVFLQPIVFSRLDLPRVRQGEMEVDLPTEGQREEEQQDQLGQT